MLKKFTVLIAIAAFLTINKNELKAQNQLGAYVYPVFTSIQHSTDNNQYYTPTPSISGGIGFDYIHFFDNKHRSRLIGGRFANDVRSRWGIRGGIHFVGLNSSWKAEGINNGPDKPNTWEGKKRLRYIKLPVAAQYIIPFTPKFKSKYLFGLQPGVLVSADGGLVMYDSKSGYFDLPEHKDEYYNRFSFDAFVGVGVYYQVTRWWNVSVIGKLDYGLLAVEDLPSEIQKPNAPEGKTAPLYGVGEDRDGGHNLSLSLLIGVEYSFHRAADRKSVV